MKVKLYEKMQGATPVYETIFDGSIPEPVETTVQSWFEKEPPPECSRQKLSGSVIAALPGEDGEREYLEIAADAVKEVNHFSEANALPLHGHRMLVIEPGQAPREAVVGDDLRSLQKAVGGFIECIYPFEDNSLIIDNEEGKLIGLEGNRILGDDIIAGTFLLTADDGEGGFMDLTDEQVAKYTRMFQTPDVISDRDYRAACGFICLDMEEE